jgi:O-succinylbenzoic acid--CoA ligase
VTGSPAQALAAGRGSATALAWPGGRIDYETLADRVAGLAGALRAACPAGGPVGVVSSSRRRLAEGVLAADWAGRPALPLDPARQDLAQALARAGATAVVCDEVLPLPEGLVPVSFDGRGPEFPPAEREGPALIVSTSGTGGPPRLVVLEGRALAAQAEASARVLPRLEAGTLWLVCLPMTSIGALAALWRALPAGAGVAVLERFDPDGAGQLMATEVTHISVVPAMLPPLVERLEERPAGLVCALSGGGPLSWPVARQALAAGWPLWTGWGMTETASHVVAGPVDSDWAEGIAGRPLPGVSVTGDPGSGRLRVAGPTLMTGYLGPAGPWGLGADGSLLTQDAGRVEPDGRVRVCGRADGVILTGGVNVHPEEVEAALAGCPGVCDLAVVGLPDARWGQRIVALYCGTAGPEAMAAWAEEAWKAGGLEPALRPREWRRLEAVPRNPMGKLDRPALAALAGAKR